MAEYQKSLAAVRAKLTPDQGGDFDDALNALLFGGGGGNLVGAFALMQPDGLKTLASKVNGKTGVEVIKAGLAQEIEDDTKQEAVDQAAVMASQAEHAKFAAALGAIKISGARYSLGGSFIREPEVHFVITNAGPSAVKKIYAHGTLSSPGRTIPWLSKDINYEFPGGLEPGETQALDLEPNMFEWGGDFADRKDLNLQIVLLNYENANGEKLLNLDSDVDDKASEARAKQVEITKLKQRLAKY